MLNSTLPRRARWRSCPENPKKSAKGPGGGPAKRLLALARPVPDGKGFPAPKARTPYKRFYGPCRGFTRMRSSTCFQPSNGAARKSGLACGKTSPRSTVDRLVACSRPPPLPLQKTPGLDHSHRAGSGEGSGPVL